MSSDRCFYYSIDSVKSTYNLYVDYLLYKNFGEYVILNKPLVGHQISSTKEEKVIGGDDFYDIVEITTKKVVKRDKSGFTMMINYCGLPATISALAKEIGVSRQSLSKYKDEITEVLKQGKMPQKLGRSFTFFPLEVIEDLVKLIDAATITDYHNAMKVALYMITSIRYYNDGFCRSYQLIAEECDVNKDLVMRVIKKLISNGFIEVKHLGNNVQRFATTYKLTEGLKEKLTDWSAASSGAEGGIDE